jgi:hypothetical protein
LHLPRDVFRDFEDGFFGSCSLFNTPLFQQLKYIA